MTLNCVSTYLDIIESMIQSYFTFNDIVLMISLASSAVEEVTSAVSPLHLSKSIIGPQSGQTKLIDFLANFLRSSEG